MYRWRKKQSMRNKSGIQDFCERLCRKNRNIYLLNTIKKKKKINFCDYLRLFFWLMVKLVQIEFVKYTVWDFFCFK